VLKFKQDEFTKSRISVQLNSAINTASELEVRNEVNSEKIVDSHRMTRTSLETNEQQMMKTKSAAGFGQTSSQGGTTILSTLRKK